MVHSTAAVTVNAAAAATAGGGGGMRCAAAVVHAAAATVTGCAPRKTGDGTSTEVWVGVARGWQGGGHRGGGGGGGDIDRIFFATGQPAPVPGRCRRQLLGMSAPPFRLHPSIGPPTPTPRRLLLCPT